MDIAIWLVGTVIGGLLSIVLTLLFSEPLKRWIAPFIRRLGTSEKRGIEGVWIATFSVARDGVTTEFNEVIELTQSFGMVFGKIKASPENYAALRAIQDRSPLRVRGEFIDNTYFTGLWFHPLDTHRFHGSFQLVLQGSGEEMRGRWIGFSESLRQVDTGRWIWRRHDSA